MKRFSYTVLLIGFIAALSITRAAGQEPTPTPSPSPVPSPAAAVTKVGAYRSIPVRNADVRAAYAFAVKTQSAVEKKPFAFVRVLKAESQVVAGMNYRICMLVREGKGRSKSVTVVVNRDLKRVWSLTQWVEGGCKEI